MVTCLLTISKPQLAAFHFSSFELQPHEVFLVIQETFAALLFLAAKGKADDLLSLTFELNIGAAGVFVF